MLILTENNSAKRVGNLVSAVATGIPMRERSFEYGHLTLVFSSSNEPRF